MVKTVDINEAKTKLSQLVERAEKGEDIVIARAGRPVARLVGFQRAPRAREAGRLPGRIRIGRDFDAPFPLDLFEG